MARALALTFFLAVLAAAMSCSQGEAPSTDTPTEAYKRLYSAVKAKDVNAIKQQLTKRSIEFTEMSAQRFGKTPEQQFANGLTATTFSDTLPPMRDERVKGKMAALEVWNSRESLWEDLPFILGEDGRWKLAIGDTFGGNYVSPGKGRSELEREAANAAGNRASAPTSRSNSSMNGNVVQPQQRSNGK